MSAPTPYVPSYSYTAFQQGQGNNTFPGTQIDNDFIAVKATTDDIIAALGDVRASSGGLKNEVVTYDSLSATVTAQFARAAAAALRGVSSSSITIGMGAKAFTTTETGRQWAIGSRVRLSTLDAQNIIEGNITSANPDTGAYVVYVDYLIGSGTHTDWTVTIAGAKGESGDATPELEALRDAVNDDAAQVAADKAASAASAAAAGASETSAASSASAAGTSALAAAGSASSASTSADTASGAASAAIAAASAADGAADDAIAAASAASGSASAASTSAGNAATSASAAQTAETNAETAQAAAEAARTAAEAAAGSIDEGYLLNRANHTGTQDADTIVDGSANKVFTAAEQTKLSGVEAAADVTDAANVGAVLNATSKASPVDADRVYEGNSAASFALVYSTWTQIKAFLKTYFDTLYQVLDAQLFSNIPQNSKSAAYTLVLTDAQKHIFHPSADTTARVWTIPANSSVAFPIGTAVTFVNQNGAGVITIAITTDTMRLAGAGTTGSRTLAANGMATAVKVTSTEWIISGAGLT